MASAISVALRGRPAAGQRKPEMYAADLVSPLEEVGDSDISVAARRIRAHPEAAAQADST